MKAPEMIKQGQILNEMITSLGHFISRATKRYLPFFKTLKGGKEFEWIEEYEQAFKDLKKYLGEPPCSLVPSKGSVGPK